jgi:hypothetical protein
VLVDKLAEFHVVLYCGQTEGEEYEDEEGKGW